MTFICNQSHFPSIFYLSSYKNDFVYKKHLFNKIKRHVFCKYISCSGSVKKIQSHSQWEIMKKKSIHSFVHGPITTTSNKDTF